jgi:hypothetical protein
MKAAVSLLIYFFLLPIMSESTFPVSTLASTKSLRPKPFKRLAITTDSHEDEIFLSKSIETLKNGTFLQIHTKCLLDAHEK